MFLKVVLATLVSLKRLFPIPEALDIYYPCMSLLNKAPLFSFEKYSPSNAQLAASSLFSPSITAKNDPETDFLGLLLKSYSPGVILASSSAIPMCL